MFYLCLSSLLQCSLHIHASYSISMKLNVPMQPLAESNAVGLILAHGDDFPHHIPKLSQALFMALVWTALAPGWIPNPVIMFPSALSLGSVGGAISVLSPDVYASDDGGYTWFLALKGPHHYAILDSGGLLVAVEHNPSHPISQIKWVYGLSCFWWFDLLTPISY